jgi:cation/acetate symporter
VQIIKAILLMTATIVLSLFVLGKVGFNPVELFNRAADESEAGKAFLAPGQLYTQPIDTLSPGLALVLGTAGLPHILMRFFTVPDAKAARGSVMWAVVLIGAFYVMTTFLGFGARALLGGGAEEAVGSGGNLAAPLLAENVGGGAGTVGGDLFPGDHRGGGVRDDPRGGGRAGHLRLGRGGSRRVVEHRASRA